MTGLGLLPLVTALTSFSLVSSLWIIFRTLYPLLALFLNKAGGRPRHDQTGSDETFPPTRLKLLPAQRLQLLLSAIDIPVVILFDWSLRLVLFRQARPPYTPLIDAPSTFGICISLVLRSALIGVFACNSFCSIWLERSLDSDWKVFLPPGIISGSFAGFCAVLVRFLETPDPQAAIITYGQGIASACLIVFISIAAIVSTLAFTGIIWAVWMSRQQQQQQQRLLLARRQSQFEAASLITPEQKGCTEFGVANAAPTNTFGQPQTKYMLSTNRRIMRAFDRTMGYSDQTNSTNAAGRSNPRSAAPSSFDAYDQHASSSTNVSEAGYSTCKEHTVESAEVLRDVAITSQIEPPFRHTFDFAFDGTFTSQPSDVSVPQISPGCNASPPPSPRESERLDQKTLALDKEHCESTRRKRTISGPFSFLSKPRSFVNTVLASGFVVLDSNDVRISAARQGLDQSLSQDEDLESGTSINGHEESSHSNCEPPSLSTSETYKALIRLSGLIFSVWLPMPFALPYLVNGWVQDIAAPLDYTPVILLTLAVTLTSPLLALQVFLADAPEARKNRDRATSSSTKPKRSSIDSQSRQSPGQPVAGLGYEDCNGYDFGLVKIAQADVSAEDSQVTPLQMDTFGGKGARKSTGQYSCVSSQLSNGGKRSICSVAYVDEHWASGKILGDRVVEPRSAFVRAVSLMWSPKPRLDILPMGVGHDRHRPKYRPSVASEPEAQGCPSRCSSARRSLGANSVMEATRTFDVTGVSAVHAASTTQMTTQSEFVRREEKKQSVLMDQLTAMLLPELVPGLSIGDESRSQQEESSVRRRKTFGVPHGTISSRVENIYHSRLPAGMDIQEGEVDEDAVEDLDAPRDEENKVADRSTWPDDTLPSCYIKADQYGPTGGSSNRARNRIRDSTPLRHRSTASKSQSRLEDLEEIPLRPEDESPGKSRHCRSFSASSIFAASTPGSGTSLSRKASRSFGSFCNNSPANSLFSQASDLISRKRRKSCITDLSSGSLPGYIILDDLRGEESQPQLLSEAAKEKDSHQAPSERPLSATQVNVSETVSVDQGKEDSTKAGTNAVSEPTLADVDTQRHSRPSLAKSLGLEKSRSLTGTDRKTLGENMGLDSRPQGGAAQHRRLSSELGIDSFASISDVWSSPRESDTCSSSARSASNHRRQETLGSISVISSCISEEIIISPDPSPNKSAISDTFGARLHESLRDRDRAETTANSARDTTSSFILPRIEEELVADGEEEDVLEPEEAVNHALALFRERYPVRILSPVEEMTEDGSAYGGASCRASLDGSVASISSYRHSLAPSVCSSRRVTTSFSRPRSFQISSPAPSIGRVQLSPSPKRMLHQAQVLTELSFSRASRKRDDIASLCSMIRRVSLTPQKSPAKKLPDLSFDESFWNRSPPSLRLDASRLIDSAPAEASPDLESVKKGLRHASIAAADASLPSRFSNAKRRSTSSMRLLASSGASALNSLKDLRLRSGNDNGEKRRSMLTSPLNEFRAKLKKFERRPSILKNNGTPGPASKAKRPKKSFGRVAVITDRHRFTVVDGDDSFVHVGRANDP